MLSAAACAMRNEVLTCVQSTASEGSLQLVPFGIQYCSTSAKQASPELHPQLILTSVYLYSGRVAARHRYLVMSLCSPVLLCSPFATASCCMPWQIPLHCAFPYKRPESSLHPIQALDLGLCRTDDVSCPSHSR